MHVSHMLIQTFHGFQRYGTFLTYNLLGLGKVNLYNSNLCSAYILPLVYDDGNDVLVVVIPMVVIL